MSHEEGTERFGIQLSGLPGPIGRILSAKIRKQRPPRTFVDQSRSGKPSITVDELTRPRPIFQIRKKPTTTVPGGRPIIRIQRAIGPTPAHTRRVPKPPEIIRATPTGGRVFTGGSPTFDERAGGFSFPASGASGAPARPPKAIAKVEPEVAGMSLHKDLLKRLAGAGLGKSTRSKIVSGVIGGIAGRVLPGLGRVATSPAATAGGIGLAVGSLFGRGGGAAQDGACPVGHHLNKQDGVGGPAGTYCVKNRRMNVGNARAARRSVRRLKGARKLLRDIEKMMPTRSTRRRAPAGHSAHLHHTGGN